MNRRRFLCGGILAMTVPLTAEGQQPGKVYRIGVISSAGMPGATPGQGKFWERMRELGWIYGQNVIIEQRMFGDDGERIPALAKELLRESTDVFVVPNGTTAAGVLRVTRTTPIVVASAGDLVAAGFVNSLARPGGNVTGFQVMQTEMAGKHLALLKETIPGLSRVGALIGDPGFTEANLSSPGANAAWVHEIKTGATVLGLQAHVVIIEGKDDVEKAFATFKSRRTQALVLYGSNLMLSLRHTIAALALSYRLPTICSSMPYLSAGYLMSYGLDPQEIPRVIAEMVDKIFRGTRAGDIPVQQPTSFSLAINLKTARALGITIPRSLLARADQVLE
jgi:putative ABC transport system substrate-binding protein